MKYSFIIVMVLIGHISLAQKYYTKTGFTEFKASVKAFEPVDAKTNSTTAVVNIENGEIAALLFIKAFHFKVALMEEHFNENYMDSDVFPKAKFTGEILNFNKDELLKDFKKYPISGTLTIRGLSEEISFPIALRWEGDKLIAKGEFIVSPSDYNIEIPSIVKNKISETVKISFNYELLKKE